MKRGAFWIALIGAMALMIGGCGQSAEVATLSAVETSEAISASDTTEAVSESITETETEQETEEVVEEVEATSQEENADNDDTESEVVPEESISYGPKSSVASTDVTAMDRNVLMTAYQFLRTMDSQVQSAVADKAFVENLVGIPGELNRTEDNGDEYYRWSESDTVYLEIALREREGGQRTAANILLYNITSDEYENVDMFAYLEPYDYSKEIVIEDNGVTFTATVPEEWYHYDSPFGQRITWSYTEELAEKGTNYIKFAAADSLEEINKNLEKYEDVVDLDPVSVSGNEMSARSYRYIGYDTIEYYGQVASGKYVSISYIKLPMLQGSPQEVIRDTLVIN